MKLFHVADIHLGCRRLNGRLPDTDFADAFRFIAHQAIEERAEVFLIAGDLFDRAQVEPAHLRQAQQILIELKAAGIKTIGIEGNHDKAFLHADEPTWVQFLADDDLLILLRPKFDGDGAVLNLWDPQRKQGAWIDLGGIRFVGAGYLGAATPHKTRQIIERLEPGRRHVVLLHAGPDYFVGEGGGFSSTDIASIREKVCYLALGHIHRPMKYGEWACNPGSPENCDLREAANDFDRNGVINSRGYAVVEIEPNQTDKPATFVIQSNPRRPVHRLTLDCSPFGNKLREGGAAFVKAAVKLVRGIDPKPGSIIDLQLTGKLNLNRVELDQATVSREIREQTGVNFVAIDMGGINVGNHPGASPDEKFELTREDLEKEAIKRLLNEENLFGLENAEAEFATLLYEIKEAVRTNRQIVELVEQIGSNALVDRIVANARAEYTRSQPEGF
jgi:DNA repair protein SbcD/Mre11